MDSTGEKLTIGILVIDKDVRNYELLRSILGEQYRYCHMENVAEAKSVVDEGIGGYMLAFLSLDYACEEISSFLEAACYGLEDCLPVIMTGGEPCEDKLSLAYESGALDYLKLHNSDKNDIRRLINFLQLLVQGRSRYRHLEETDNLTGTLNLSGLRRRFEESLKRYPDSRFVVFYADIKDFKYFNTLFGYKAGDDLLNYWCETINKHRKGKDLICRMSGDRIVVLVRENRRRPHRNRFDAVLADVREHFKEAFGEYIIDIAGGYYEYDPRKEGPVELDQLIAYARQAQKSVKNKSGSGYAIYNEEMWSAQRRKLEINGHLERAIRDGEIMVYAQPQYNYVTGELIGAECLCRWKHHEWGMISPGEFIPALEETGRIFELDYFVWETACKCMRKWLDRGQRISLSVNVSRKDIDHADLPAIFKGLIDKYQIPADMLRIEITESAYMEETGRLIELVRNLSGQGFSVEMDDFGSGFSSLNLLHDIAIDVLKLDVGFLQDSKRNDISGSIVNAVIKMAHIIGIRVLAEGVENMEQAEFLKSNGCLFAQGFFFSKPLPMESFEELLQNASISELKKSYKRFQVFNIQELYDRNSSGFFIFNNCMGPAALFDYNKSSLQPVIINDAFCDLIGFSRGYIEESRRNVFDIFARESVETLKNLMDEAIRSGRSEGEIYVARIGRYLKITFRHVATRDNVELCFCEGEDVTNKRILEERLTELQRDREAQMTYMPGGTFRCILRENGPMDYVSEGLIKMMGYDSMDAFLEKHRFHDDMICVADRARVHESLNRQCKTQNICKVEYRMEKRDGSLIWVHEAGHIVEDGQGGRVVYGVIADIDHIKKEQMEKRWYEKKLQAVFEMPGIMLYEYNPGTDTMLVSMRQENGDLKERVADYYLEKLAERKWVHREDVEKYADAIRSVVALGAYQSVNARVLFPKGEFHLCKYHFSPVLDEDGKVYRIFGRAERLPEESGDKGLSVVPAGEFRCQAEGLQPFDYVSRSFIDMLGFAEKDEFRQSCDNSFVKFIYEEDVDRVIKEIQDQIQNSDNFYCEYRVRTSDGSLKWIYNRGTLVLDAQGVRWFYVAVIDLHAYKVEQEKKQCRHEELVNRLRTSAQQDTMTRLYNHNHSLQMIQQELSHERRDVFMMIDVDDFKNINDTRGHIFGDEVLCQVADSLRESFGEESIIGRFGGDEFICYINSELSRTEIERLANEVINRTGKISIGDKKTLGVSIGIVENTKGISDPIQLVKRADDALYHVKRNGKGGYAFWSMAIDSGE